MKKIVFFCIPAYGHTNPTLGVVKELVQQGNKVWYYSYEPFREMIEQTGAIFVSCNRFDPPENLTAKNGAKVAKDIAFATKVLVDTTLSMDDAIYQNLLDLQPDCIVADSMALWGKLLAKKLNAKFVSSTTTFAFNKESSKIMGQDLSSIAKMIFGMPKIGKELRRLQEKGYPVNSVLDIIANDPQTDTIVYTSPEFQPCSESFTDKYAFVGPSIRPVKEPFQKEKDKLIYISMGTVNNDLLPLYQACISALENTDYQVVVSVGHQVNLKKIHCNADNISIYPSVDQIAVLEKADLFITHCGMNSVNEALYFGVPLLMLPQTAEQKGVARRVEQLGAGVMLKGHGAKGIHQSVTHLLCSEEYHANAASIAKGFRRCSGAKGAAQKILDVCNS